ncbi:hypothetical protein A3K63_00750 [Candidatus Micrarchaeota archaeon RBG_16_49_10]|nr:MAG: hypothetical protein A3K63_00750 [Candidatus Micrarchaeota archaeon RBG_16_49_10]
MPKKQAGRIKLGVHYRVVPWAHRDYILTRLPFGKYPPYHKLNTRHDFLADVKMEGENFATITEPEIMGYEDVYKRRLIKVGADLSTPAEWTLDLPNEYQINSGELNEGRLLSLVVELYATEEAGRGEREEYHLDQNRKSFSQHPISIPINMTRKILGEKVELMELGELYSADFSIKPNTSLELDEDVIPQRVKTLGAVAYTLRDSDGELYAKIYREPVSRLLSFGIARRYGIEIPKKYSKERELILFVIALTDFIDSKKSIRRNPQVYDNQNNIPTPERILGYN